MNQTERKTLANIVSEMIYGFESGSQLISSGQQILRAFPSIAGDVEDYRYPMATSNIIACVRAALINLNESKIPSDVKIDLHKRTFDSIEDIFDDYLENYSGNEFYSTLYVLEEKLANADNAQATLIVSELVQSMFWRNAVAEVFDTGTVEFCYLTINFDDLR